MNQIQRLTKAFEALTSEGSVFYSHYEVLSNSKTTWGTEEKPYHFAVRSKKLHNHIDRVKIHPCTSKKGNERPGHFYEIPKDREERIFGDEKKTLISLKVVFNNRIEDMLDPEYSVIKGKLTESTYREFIKKLHKNGK